MKDVDNFKEERKNLNDLVMKYAKKNMKRFYNLDENVYTNGALGRKTKELLGLVSSLVLRCDDCVEYHLITTHELGTTSAEIEEALSVGLVVGGSIVIPHLRHAFLVWEELEKKRFDDVEQKIKALLTKEIGKSEKLKDTCRMLRKRIPHYDWVGFYFVEGKELILGPFDGEPTEHVRIKIGQGVCGQAAQRMEMFVVADVSKESNYLSCSPKVKSEMVLPIFKDGNVIGELDIDSHTIDAFSENDKIFLANICEEVSKIL